MFKSNNRCVNMSFTLRWGILSAGAISHDFCVALGTLPSDEHKVIAVAARQLDRAKEFAIKHGIPQALGSYKELAEHPDINVIYIGALNPQHYELTLLMLNHGKHVLCEKPLCLNYKQAKEVIQHAEAKKLFLMEAVWSRFFPAYQYLRKQISAGNLGDIQSVDVKLGNAMNEQDRLQKKELGGGTVLDLGIYTIQCSQWVFQETPKKIVADGELNNDGVDIVLNAELHYTGRRVAKMTCSAKERLDNTAVIKGTKGQITLINCWCPTKIIDIDGNEKDWPLPKGKYPTNFPNSEGLRYEAEAVRESIMKGQLENDTVTHKESLMFAKIEDEIRKQLGVVYK